MLDLTDAQTAQMEKIQVDMMKQQRTLMRQIWDAQGKLNDLTKTDKRDLTAIGKAYVKLADMQQQALAAHIDAENKMTAMLTKEQKAQMHRGFGKGMMGY
jgi:Spy/CpxP family protein refolding chaperone